MLLTICTTVARLSARQSPSLALLANRRNLSFKEKQKRKMPQPKSFTQEEYDKQYEIVQDLKGKCEAVTAEITPLQRREADLRKKEYELWQEVRAIKRTFLEGTPQMKAAYLRWELKQREQRDKEERAGLRKPHKFQVLYW